MTRQKSIFEGLPAEPTEYSPANVVAVAAEKEADSPSSLLLMAVPSPRPPFELELRRLVRRRLSGELGFEEFCRLNLELHFRYGRSGYDLAHYERDIAEYRERERRVERRRQLEHTLHGKLELLERAPAEPNSSSNSSSDAPPRAVGA